MTAPEWTQTTTARPKTDIKPRGEIMTMRFDTEESFQEFLRTHPDYVDAMRGRAEEACLAHNQEDVSSSLTPATNESDFQKWLIGELNRTGWFICEFRKARVRKAGIDVYRTPFGADGVGFPDLFAVRPPRVLIIEDKSVNGTASPEQIKWLLLLGKCPQLEVKCWSPRDRIEILETIA